MSQKFDARKNQFHAPFTQHPLIASCYLRKRGIQFAFKNEDLPGSIKGLTDIIRHYGGCMVSILSTYEGMTTGYKKVPFRKRSPGKGTLLYVADHRENRKELFRETPTKI